MTVMLVKLGSWRAGYHLVGGVLVMMAVLFFLTRHRWSERSSVEHGEAVQPSRMRAALRELLVWLQIVLFFVYVGLEFTVGQWSFTLLTESRNVRPDVAGMLAGSYYGAIGMGRVLSGIIATRVGLDQLVRFSMIVALVGTLLFAFGSTDVGLLGPAFIGLGLAPVFPCLMARTPQRLGAGCAAHAVGFQVSSGMLGAALVPGLAGLLTEKVGLDVVAQFAVLLAGGLFLTHELLLHCARQRGAARRSDELLCSPAPEDRDSDAHPSIKRMT